MPKDDLMSEDRPIARDQRRANWLIEALSGASLFALLGLVWYAAQQSQNVDVTLEAVNALKEQTQTYQQEARRAATTVQRDVDRLGVRVEIIAENVRHNRAYLDKLEDRVNDKRTRSMPGGK